MTNLIIYLKNKECLEFNCISFEYHEGLLIIEEKGENYVYPMCDVLYFSQVGKFE